MISKVFSLKKKRRITKLLPFIFSFLSSAIGIILNFILARAFGSDNYGEIQYLVSLATTASSFMTFGLSWIVVRDAKNENRSSQFINSVFTIFFFLAIFEAPIVFFILYNFTKITHDNYLFSLLVVIVAVIIGTNTIASMRSGSILGTASMIDGIVRTPHRVEAVCNIARNTARLC